MSWITSSEQKQIIESATRAQVSPKNIARIKRAMKTAGVSILQNPIKGGYLGIETARGNRIIWGEYVGMTRTV